ncbi:exodeoxyribonuclease III [Haloechinothrix sp. YIM 98757]|uniref:Exodeoxyribonuclease III n=1 Tax=Haloechinothrix aidingensis TaxID=2752311 RepID=A0A838AG79_9PSEU|nr:exodeoxyribonuclease III [Haloechinothrix aidingensis]
MLTVSTVNVNGLRAAARKGYTSWLDGTDADIVALQEVRAEPDQLAAGVRDPEGWHRTIAPAADKGRNGVALLSRREPHEVRVGFGSTEFDAAGRYLEYEFENLVVGSLYLPSGEVGTARQDEKERFLDEFLRYLKTMREYAEAEGKEVLVAGDWNIAHAEIDLKNWKNNQKTAGFLPEERAWLTRVLDEAGYVDVHRALEPEGPGPYSWWSYRGKAFDNDAGWRIDYQMATPTLAGKAVSGRVERAPSYDQRWSDHAPVTIAFDWALR